MGLIRGSFFHTVMLTTEAADDALAYVIDEAPGHGWRSTRRVAG